MKDFCSPLIPLVALGLLVLTGCSPKNVEMLLLDGPERLETNESGAFNATVNEDAKPPVLYEWTFGDGTTAEGATTTHAFPEAGSYTYTVTASNRNGKASVTEAGSVMIVDPPVPAQILAVLASTVDTDTQTPVQFSANVRGDAPLSYTWAFGDGASSSSPRPSHTFMEAGRYSVSLELSNAHGRDARTLNVDVAAYEAEYCRDLAEMNTAFFERNSSVLTNRGQQALADNLDILRNCPDIHVRIEGLASPLERNQQALSEDRARAVREYYTDQGIAGRRITSIGLGSADGTSKKSGADQFQRADTIPLR